MSSFPARRDFSCITDRWAHELETSFYFLTVDLAVTILPIPRSILMPSIMLESSWVKPEDVFRLYQPLRSLTISSSKGFYSLRGLMFPPPVALLGQSLSFVKNRRNCFTKNVENCLVEKRTIASSEFSGLPSCRLNASE